MNAARAGLRRVACRAIVGVALTWSGAAAFGADGAVDPTHWAMPAGNAANHRFSPLRQIHNGNVGKLQVAWTFSTGVPRGHQGNPLVVGDRMYLHSPFPNRVIALDLNTRNIVWRYEPKQDPMLSGQMCCDTVSRGLAYGDGKILLQQANTELVALDAKTGRVIWSVTNGDPALGAVNTNAPHVFKDKVITGIAGGTWGVRGFLSAYDLATGRRLWRAYSTGPDEELLVDPLTTTTWIDGKVQPVGRDSSLRSWSGDQWKTGGGTTWGWYSYDAETNLIYYGTDNAGSLNARQRPGDNRWTASIWARDLDTGRARWVFQTTPHDEWNYGAASEMILSDLRFGRRTVKTLVHFDRNGFAYTLDRASGALLVADKFAPEVNWADGIDRTSGRPRVAARYSTDGNGPDVVTRNICPASLGTKNQQPAAFNPANGLFYVPVSHLCMDYEPFHTDYAPGMPVGGAKLSMLAASGAEAMGGFILWDAVAGKIVQSAAERMPVWSGALVTAGGIACYGTLDGYLKCVDAGNIRRERYRFKTPSGIMGNVFTYEHKGRQYIGVYSGMGGWPGTALAGVTVRGADGKSVIAYPELSHYENLGGSLTVFALPE